MKRRSVRLTYTPWYWIYFYAWNGGLITGIAINQGHTTQWVLVIVFNALFTLGVRIEMHNNRVYSRVEGIKILRDAEKEHQ